MRYNKHILLEGIVEDAQKYFEKAVGSWPVAEPGNPAGIGAGTNLESVFIKTCPVSELSTSFAPISKIFFLIFSTVFKNLDHSAGFFKKSVTLYS